MARQQVMYTPVRAGGGDKMSCVNFRQLGIIRKK